MGYLISTEIVSRNKTLKISNFSLINKLRNIKNVYVETYDKEAILNFLENLVNEDKNGLIKALNQNEEAFIIENYRCTLSNKFSKLVYSVV